MPKILAIQTINDDIWCNIGRVGDFENGAAIWSPSEQKQNYEDGRKDVLQEMFDDDLQSVSLAEIRRTLNCLSTKGCLEILAHKLKMQGKTLAVHAIAENGATYFPAIITHKSE